jgi:hypothetical protein
MGKTSVATRIAAIALATELGVKPSRTVRQMQELATLPRDLAPRKGSEGRRPEAGAKDWETPVANGSSSWGYVVAGSPKRVISLPDSNPEYWAAVQGEVLLGHVRHSFAHSVGEEFDYLCGRVSRVSPAAVVLRYLRRYPINSKVKVTLIRESAVGVEYFDYDHVAEDVVHHKYALSGGPRHIVERLRWISIGEEPRRDY